MKKKAKKILEGSTINDLVSISEAARIRGVTHGAIQDLIERGRLKVVTVAGRRLLHRGEVTDFEKLPAGRPAKPASTEKRATRSQKRATNGTSKSKKGSQR